ncbi:MAG: carboxymuconolactone decarboxylase family protein [Deltaproteobacteria bacterium]|nr:carboxymuconolactone decarboxylase family protein [Candidatus Tharpella aukensis]
MLESQIDLNNNRKKQLGRVLEIMPKQGKQLMAQIGETYEDGALERKSKHLMALAMALGAGCQNCVLFHTEAALESGATKEEFLETISVVISMRGTTGVAESLRVIQFLDESGKL